MKCIHMTAEMAHNCPVCNPDVYRTPPMTNDTKAPPERIWAWEEHRTFRWWTTQDTLGGDPHGAPEYVRADLALSPDATAVLEAVKREAVEQERERCARIAEDDDMRFTQWGQDDNTKVAQQTAQGIAAAIRESE